VNPANGHTYYLLTSQSWTASEAESVSLGGHLATINDASEDTWVFDTFAAPNRMLWIGLNDVQSERVFVWSSGESVTYTGWAPSEPQGGLDENWVAIRTQTIGPARKWIDWQDNGNFFGVPVHGVVEVSAVPEPSSLVELLRQHLYKGKPTKPQDMIKKDKDLGAIEGATGQEPKADRVENSKNNEALPAASADTPPIKTGDTYIIESLYPDNPKLNSATERKVISVSDGKITVASKNIKSKTGSARTIQFTPEWNLISGRNPDGSGLDYSPPLKYFEFPLYPGKTWRQTSVEKKHQDWCSKGIHIIGDRWRLGGCFCFRWHLPRYKNHHTNRTARSCYWAKKHRYRYFVVCTQYSP
jgi:hypothetical protein